MKANQNTTIVKELNAFNERISEINSQTSFEQVKHCVSKLKRALYENNDCAALCAPQIGENLRLFVVRTSRDSDERFKVFLNPMIISSEGLHMSREANLSFPGKEFIIPRKDKLHLAYQTIDGRVESDTYLGAYAEVIQQMVEMLDGITLADYGLDLDDIGGPAEFDNASKKSKSELIALYLETLKEYSQELATEIDSNPELKYMNDVIKFNTGVLKGDIEIIKKPLPENMSEASDGV